MNPLTTIIDLTGESYATEASFDESASPNYIAIQQVLLEGKSGKDKNEKGVSMAVEKGE